MRSQFSVEEKNREATGFVSRLVVGRVINHLLVGDARRRDLRQEAREKGGCPWAGTEKDLICPELELALRGIGMDGKTWAGRRGGRVDGGYRRLFTDRGAMGLCLVDHGLNTP